MRIPLAGNISTKDGAANKNSRLYNVLAETRKDGKVIAGVRPGLTQLYTVSGNGNGIVCFNGSLISLFGATLGTPSGDQIIPTETLSTISGYIIFHGVKLNNGLYVLVDGTAIGTGEPGNIFTTTAFSSYTKKLTDYTYGLGRVVGNGSVAICSYDDGDGDYGVATINQSGTVTFNQILSPILTPLCYGNGVFVARTDDRKWATSSSGSSWSVGSYSFSYVDGFPDIQWNGSVYCMIYSIAADSYLYARTSSDLETWSSAVQILDTATAGGAGSVCFTVANGAYVIVLGNTVAISQDGQTWQTSAPFANDFDSRAISYNDTSDKLCVVGGTSLGNAYARYFSFDDGVTLVSDDGTYLTPTTDVYTGVMPYLDDFVTFSNKVPNNVQVLSNVGFGITDIGSLIDSPIDTALIP